MTDFERYIGVKLLNSDEDCCSICAFQQAIVKPDAVSDEDMACENLKREELSDDICLQGIRAYFERFEEAHA